MVQNVFAARWRARVAAALAAVSAIAGMSTANAVPSFARQTGEACAECHVGAYGPKLTPHGIRFKLSGYTDSNGQGMKIPLSAMVAASYTKNRADDISSTKFDEISVFLAGRITEHLGTFTQVTYEPPEHNTALDQIDIRYAYPLSLGGKDSIVGVSINNNPGVQDPFNTLSPWAFPYQPAHDFESAVGAERTGLGGLEGNVAGASAYLFWNDSIYAEAGVYDGLSPATQSKLGVASRSEARAAGKLSSAGYWRLAYTQDHKTNAWSIGLIGADGKIKNIENDVGDLEDTKFTDVGIDGSYQLLGTRRHIWTVDASAIRERTNTEGDKARSKDYKLSSSYYFNNTVGGTLGLFKANTTGGEADNRGYILQADWNPWGKEGSWSEPFVNLRLGVQYIGYNRYVDEGTKVKASDRNTWFVFAWTSF